MSVCLLPDQIENFKKALITRKINLADLLNMETDKRIELLRDYAGDNAKDVNQLIESKLVLKNRELGIRNALRKLTETGRYSLEEKARLESIKTEWRAAQQERIFSPRENEAFLNSLADKAAGTEITREEAKTLFELDSRSKDLLSNYDPKARQWVSEQDRAKYGAAKVAYEKYYEYLKNPESSIREMIAERGQQFKEEYRDNPVTAVTNYLLDAAVKITDTMISTVASLDNSFIGRQGLRALYTHPTAWWPGARKSFVDLVRTLGGAETMNDLMADVYSRPNYINGQYHDSGILNPNEEQFPSSLPERIPVLGRVFKASEVAFKGSAIRIRTDLYDLISRVGTDQGVDFSDPKESKAIGEMINSLTAKGSLGAGGTPKLLKLFIWAPKMIKSHFDVLLDPFLAKSSFARQQARWNLAKIIGVMVVISQVANAIWPGSAELDPRSSDFGKIKIGNTRFDYTGGMGSLIVLIARELTNQTKSTTTGQITEFNSGFGKSNRFTTFVDYLSNKATPPVSAAYDFMKGLNRDFKPPTVGDEFYRAVTPIAAQNIVNLKDDHSTAAVAGAIADFVGISSNTYKPLEKKKK